MAFTNVGSAENEFSGSVGVSNPTSFSVSIPDLAANSIGWVNISVESIAAATAVLSGVTWGGQATTKAIPASNALTNQTAHIYYLVNPPDNGSKAFEITYQDTGASITGTLHITVGWADAGAAVSLDDTSEASGTTQNPTITSTQAGANELVISNSSSTANALGSPTTTDCTELQSWDSGGNCAISAYSIPGSSGDVTHRHNYSQSGTYGIVSASFKEAAGGIVEAIGLTSETDTAQAVAKAKAKALGPNTETDSSLAIVAEKTYPLGLTSETETAQSLTAAKTAALGLATETDTALGISTPGDILQAIGLAAETESALAIASAKALAIGQVAETDSALAITAVKTYAPGLVSETDTALGMAVFKTVVVGIASETDSALGIAVAGATTIGIASETDTALPITAAKVMAIGQASETDASLALIAVKSNALGIVSEADAALAIAIFKVLALGLVSETDAALGISFGIAPDLDNGMFKALFKNHDKRMVVP